jgi:hypothetical protein
MIEIKHKITRKVLFKTFKELKTEIEKRDYINIIGLQAEITKKNFFYFLEVLPPIPTKLGFFLMEPITHNEKGAIHYYFTKINKKYYCEIAPINSLIPNKVLIENGFI